MKISFSYANPLGNTTLDCKMIRYDIGNELETYTNYGLSTVKSFIPSNYILHFTTYNYFRFYKHVMHIEIYKNSSSFS